jgi:hypothetical protein
MKKPLLPVLAMLAGAVFAHDDHKGKPVTLIGTVVDTGCYVSHDSKGPEHATCAAACAKNGVPLAILDASGKLFFPVAAEHKNQNEKLMPFIEKKVKVTGRLMEKPGLNGIAIQTVEAAQ